MPDKKMKMQCSECKTVYHIRNPERREGTVRCRKCGNQIPISKTRAMIKCPKCGHEQPTSQECVKCGVIFKKLRTDPSDGQSGHAADPEPAPAVIPDKADPANDVIHHVKRKLMTVAIEYAADHVKGTVIAILVILVISFIFGGIPLYSALVDQDDEVMYFTQVAHCGSYKTYPLETALFQIVIGNTGENHQENVAIHLKDVPCSIDQVYYTVQNLEATEQREFDPSVQIQCDDDSRFECHRFVGMFVNPEICDYLSKYWQVLKMEYGIEDDFDGEHPEVPFDSDDPMEHGYFSPCHREEGVNRAFEIKRFASGTLVRVGFVTHDYKTIKDQWKDMEKIELEILTDAKVVKGNPQATTFAKVINAILDIF